MGKCNGGILPKSETNFYKLIKEKLSEYSPIRIETSTINGFPDLILFNKNKEPIFVEAKVGRRCDLLQLLSPHQKAFHHKYSKIMNKLFILQRSEEERAFFLYRSIDCNFLLQKANLEPCATVGFRSPWCPIKKMLDDDYYI